MEPREKQSSLSEAVRKHKEFLFPAVATYYQEPIALVKGEGEHVWDDEGNRYLDCFGGIKNTGRGVREQGSTSLDFYTELMVVYVDYTGRKREGNLY